VKTNIDEQISIENNWKMIHPVLLI